MNQETICAISTSLGYSGIGVIRISGPMSLLIAKRITQKEYFTTKQVYYCDFYDKHNEILDYGLVIFFKSPYSFTGDDVIELQCHGSPVVLQLIINRLLQLGCRQAKPGEFTQIAFLNGKIDLVQSESIIDLIHAENEASVKGALKSLKGKFSDQINVIIEKLINLRMFIEASIDFPEEDIEFIENKKIKDKLDLIKFELLKLCANTKQGVIINSGANIVIVGKPNVGKSSLLNILANEDIAIVTDIPGTTRDTIKEKIFINNVPFNIIDTAGIRDTNDIIEKIGIEKSYAVMQTASVCIIILDITIGLTKNDQIIINSIDKNIPKIFVYNKIDLITHDFQDINFTSDEGALTNVYVSAKLDIGINQLKNKIIEKVGFLYNHENTYSARNRHLNSIKKSIDHINLTYLEWGNLEIMAEELRYAHNSLCEITGSYTSDDLLGEIFSKFCIGK